MSNQKAPVNFRPLESHVDSSPKVVLVTNHHDHRLLLTWQLTWLPTVILRTTVLFSGLVHLHPKTGMTVDEVCSRQSVTASSEISMFDPTQQNIKSHGVSSNR